MKIKFVISLTILFTVLTIKSQVSWFSSYEDGKQLAQMSNKIIVLDFWADWCSPCKMMDDEVWDSEELKELSDKFVFVKYDLSSGFSNPYFSVRAIPYIVITDCFGNKLYDFKGLKSLREVKKLLKQFPSNTNLISEKMLEYKKDVKSVDNCINLAIAYQQTASECVKGKANKGFIRAAEKYLRFARKYAKKSGDMSKMESIKCIKAMNYLYSYRYKKCVREMFKLELTDPKDKQLMYFSLVKSYVKLKKMEEALKYYQLLTNMNPGEKILKQLAQEKAAIEIYKK